MSIIRESVGKIKSGLMTVILIVAAFGLARSLVEFSGTGKRFEMAEREVVRLQEERARLEAELSLENPEYVTEEQLRNALGLSKEGETVVMIPNDLLESALMQKENRTQQKTEKANWEKWAELF